jgi:hypothetical protein
MKATRCHSIGFALTRHHEAAMTDDERAADSSENPDDPFGTPDEIEEFVEAFSDGVVETPEASEDLLASENSGDEA